MCGIMKKILVYIVYCVECTIMSLTMYYDMNGKYNFYKVSLMTYFILFDNLVLIEYIIHSMDLIMK